MAAMGVLVMAGAYASQPQPGRRAAQQHVPRYRAARKRPDAHEQERATEEQTVDLSMARKLAESSNKAAAVLEIDAAHSQLSAYDLPFFKEQAQLEREQFLAEMMTAAGRGLLDSFTDVLNADDLWERLAHSERIIGQELANTPYPFRFRMELAELLTQHIPEVLRALGYRPPPPSDEWASVVQNSVHRLLPVSQDDGELSRTSAKARQELIFFTRRLRTLVEAAEQNLRADENNDESRSTVFLHSLRTIVTSARNRAIPTALAAGASAAVIGAAGGPGGIGIAFLSGGAASLFASATEAAATAWLADAGQGDTPPMSVSWAIRTDLGALDGCIDLMKSATSATIEGIRFIIRRGVFQTLQDAAGSTVPVRELLWEWSEALLLLLGAEPFPISEAHQIVNAAREVLARTSDR
jgi:hypothetical protein